MGCTKFARETMIGLLGKKLRIEFYVLSSADEKAKFRFVCQLVEEIWQPGYRICIQVASLAQAEQLDTILWTFKQESFLAHDIYTENIQSLASIFINYHVDDTCHDTKVLINLSERIPPFDTQFERIIELIDNIPASREAGRERYRFYRQAGYDLVTHEMTS